ncbi:MAG: AsmA family protein, partial [Vicinamibacterales bacterium]
MLRKLLIGIVLLVVLIGAVVVLVANGTIGNDTLRTTLEQQLTASLKQPVRIARLGASFYPQVAIDLHDITIGEPAGATIAELSITTGLRGLLSRRVEEAEVIVSNSRIPVPVAVGIAGGVASGPPSTSGGGITIVSVKRLAFRHVEVVAGTRSLMVDLESSLAGDRLDVTRLAAQSDGTRLEATGAMTSISQRQGRFTATAGQLDFDELLAVAAGLSTSTGPIPPSAPASASAPAPSSSPTAAASPLDLTVDLTAPGGRLGGYAFTALATTLHITTDALQLQPLRFGVFGGTYDGALTVATAAAPPEIALDGRIAGLDVLAILRETRGTSSLTGSLSGTVTITTRGASADDMLAAARGTGRVTIADGVIPGL